MEIKYKKDMNHNYIIMEYKEEENYELNMMLQNRINGLLKSKINIFNGCKQLYYDISSKQPLSIIYSKKELNYEDVRCVILSIRLLLDELKRYLLSPDNIVFDAEYCFCDPIERRPDWIFYPGKNEEKGMRDLAEFLMDHVCHGDKKAVDMVYRFYKLVKEDLLNKEELVTLLEEYDDNIQNVETDKVEYENGSDWFQWDKVDIISEEDDRLKNEKQGCVGIFANIKNRLERTKESVLNNIKYKSKSDIEEMNDRYREKSNEATFTKLREREYPNKSIRKQEESANWGNYDSDNGNGNSEETIVMGMQNKTTHRRLHSTLQGKGSDILLNQLPCVLGKTEACADIVIKDPSISRMHAKFFEKEGEIYMQDLNSTNGSYINHLELEGNESVRLKSGDEVTIGNLRYIYE